MRIQVKLKLKPTQTEEKTMKCETQISAKKKLEK